MARSPLSRNRTFERIAVPILIILFVTVAVRQLRKVARHNHDRHHVERAHPQHHAHRHDDERRHERRHRHATREIERTVEVMVQID